MTTRKSHIGVEDHAHGVLLILLLEGSHSVETLVEEHPQSPEIVSFLNAMIREQRVGRLVELVGAQPEFLVSPTAEDELVKWKLIISGLKYSTDSSIIRFFLFCRCSLHMFK